MRKQLDEIEELAELRSKGILTEDEFQLKKREILSSNKTVNLKSRKTSLSSEEKAKNNYFNWLLWWQIGEEELKKQVSEYESLKITQAARGISLLLLLFSSIITSIFIFFGYAESFAFIDVAIFLFLGYFIFRGHKWAMVSAMIFWTIEKFYSALSNSGNLISNLIWWSSYMHAFWLSLKVENERVKKYRS